MKKQCSPILSGAALAAVFLLSACASTQIQSIQPAADFHSARIRRVLIVSIASTPQIRKILEEEFARQWKERGVEAVASLAVLPPEATLDKAGVAPFAKAQGYDSVLVTRVMKRQKIKAEIVQPGFQVPAGSPPDETDLTDYINGVVASPEYGKEYDVVFLRTNLYDVDTEHLLWSCRSNTLIAEDVPRLIGPFVKIILKNLYRVRS